MTFDEINSDYDNLKAIFAVCDTVYEAEEYWFAEELKHECQKVRIRNERKTESETL